MSEWVRKTFDKHDRARIREYLEEAQRLQVIEGGLPPVLQDSPDIEDVISYDPDWVRWWLQQPNPKPDFDYRYPASPWSPPALLRDLHRRRFNEEIKNKKPAHWRVNLDFSGDE